MQDIIFSRQQFDAIIFRLNEIRERLSVLKPKDTSIQGCMEAHDIMLKYHISKRTLERWRQSGKVPYHKVGNFFYFNTEDIVGKIGQGDNRPVLTMPETVCLSEKELRERHRMMLLTRKYYKVPP